MIFAAVFDKKTGMKNPINHSLIQSLSWTMVSSKKQPVLLYSTVSQEPRPKWVSARVLNSLENETRSRLRKAI